MKWEVFNTYTAETICRVPFEWIAKLLVRVDRTWDYDDKPHPEVKESLRREIDSWREHR